MVFFFFGFFLPELHFNQPDQQCSQEERVVGYCTCGSRYAHYKANKAPHSTHSCTEIFAQKMWKVQKYATDSPINKQKCYFVIQSPTGSLRSLHKLIVSINIIT